MTKLAKFARNIHPVASGVFVSLSWLTVDVIVDRATSLHTGRTNPFPRSSCRRLPQQLQKNTSASFKSFPDSLGYKPFAQVPPNPQVVSHLQRRGFPIGSFRSRSRSPCLHETSPAAGCSRVGEANQVSSSVRAYPARTDVRRSIGAVLSPNPSLHWPLPNAQRLGVRRCDRKSRGGEGE